jgi:hypothetical protein
LSTAPSQSRLRNAVGADFRARLAAPATSAAKGEERGEAGGGKEEGGGLRNGIAEDIEGTERKKLAVELGSPSNAIHAGESKPQCSLIILTPESKTIVVVVHWLND